MEKTGITITELEAALGGLYTAPKDPDAPEVHQAAASTGAAAGDGITVAELVTALDGMYTAPNLEEAA
ncbi:MAG TPA: hypothetical protein VHL54_01510 [Actinomycetota bacterium]|nr:hypothetical protein [Actinomycetota bacterium]